MIDKNKTFCLYHAKTESLIESLNWTQLRGLCRTLNSDSFDSWFLWHSGLESWTSIISFIHDIVQDDDGQIRRPPFPPTHMAHQKVSHQLIDSPKEQRASERFKVQVPLIIDVAGKCTNTTTIDISFGGFLIAEPITPSSMP